MRLGREKEGKGTVGEIAEERKGKTGERRCGESHGAMVLRSKVGAVFFVGLEGMRSAGVIRRRFSLGETEDREQRRRKLEERKQISLKLGANL
jgi:hypothetical protein